MEILLQRIVTDQFRASFQKILKGEGLSAKHSFRLLRFAMEVKKHQTYFDEVNKRICEQYAKRKEDGSLDLVQDEKGQLYQFDDDGIKLFDAEFGDLISENISLPEPPLKESDVENMSLTVSDVESLVGVVISMEQ